MSVQASLPLAEGGNAPGTTAAAPAGGLHCLWCAAPLSGRQKCFCSKACNGRWHDSAHPRINRSAAGPREGTLKAAILQFLRENPGEHTEQQIADAIHGFAHSVGARLSELRRAGEPIEKRRGPGNVKLYRWVVR